MEFTKDYWANQFDAMHRKSDLPAAGSEESRQNWDARAARFAEKRKRSNYIEQLMSFIDAKPGDTIFDMGCGSGTLAVPMAKSGHDVIAVDFSPAMLEELAKLAAEEGVADKIQAFNRSWQESWDGIPAADIAVSSRSFVVDDLAEAIAKLESRAKKRVVVSIGAGDRPYRDKRIFEAMGRDADANVPPIELAVMANYLWCLGRYPRIEYAEYPGKWRQETREELVEAITKSHMPNNPEEQKALDAYLDQHIVHDDEDGGWWTLDYARTDRWAVLIWSVCS